MDIILFLFIFPIATIIFSIALQKILCNPFLVSAIILAIFLIVTFTALGINFLIAAFIYAAIALLTAYIVSIFCKIANRTIEINFIDNATREREGDNNSSCSCNNCNRQRCNNNNNIGRNLACFNENVIALSNSIDELSNTINEQNEENNSCQCSNSQTRSGNNCGTLCNGDPNTTACRTCACQRQFRNCLRRV